MYLKYAAVATGSFEEAGLIDVGPGSAIDSIVKNHLERIQAVARVGQLPSWQDDDSYEDYWIPEVAEIGTDVSDSLVGGNPLLVRGLLLAGADRHGTGRDRTGTGNGTFTGYEVAGLYVDGSVSVCRGDRKKGSVVS